MLPFTSLYHACLKSVDAPSDYWTSLALRISLSTGRTHTHNTNWCFLDFFLVERMHLIWFDLHKNLACHHFGKGFLWRSQLFQIKTALANVDTFINTGNTYSTSLQRYVIPIYPKVHAAVGFDSMFVAIKENMYLGLRTFNTLAYTTCKG